MGKLYCPKNELLDQKVGTDKLYVGLKVEVAYDDGNWYAGFIKEIHTDHKGTKNLGIKFVRQGDKNRYH